MLTIRESVLARLDEEGNPAPERIDALQGNDGRVWERFAHNQYVEMWRAQDGAGPRWAVCARGDEPAHATWVTTWSYTTARGMFDKETESYTTAGRSE